MRKIVNVYRNNKKLKRGKDWYVCHTQLNSPLVKLRFLPKENTKINIEWEIHNV